MIRLLNVYMTQLDKGVRGDGEKAAVCVRQRTNPYQCCIVRELCFASIEGKRLLFRLRVYSDSDALHSSCRVWKAIEFYRYQQHRQEGYQTTRNYKKKNPKVNKITAD